QVIARQCSAAGRTETTDRAIDDARIALTNGCVIEIEAAQAAGLEVLDENVGARGELLGRRTVLRVSQVERNRTLIAVHTQVVGGNTLVLGRHPGPGVVATWAFNLDHGR